MKYKINKGFIFQKMKNGLTIFDGEASILYTFNKTASFIFQKLKAGMDAKKIVDKITDIYKIEREVAEKDFKEFISDLKQKKIVSS